MKKPIHKFALALWVLAAIYAVSELVAVYQAFSLANGLGARSGNATYLVAGAIWNIARVTVLACSQIIGLGLLIEMVDQIRWRSAHSK